ncbi:MAG: hypothetical protein Q7T01_01950 [bacterium]|nr:hypothetical protein [bacterium]
MNHRVLYGIAAIIAALWGGAALFLLVASRVLPPGSKLMEMTMVGSLLIAGAPVLVTTGALLVGVDITATKTKRGATQSQPQRPE